MKTRYYYSVRRINAYPWQNTALEIELNRYAHDGWDVVQLLPSGESMYAIFRKPTGDEED